MTTRQAPNPGHAPPGAGPKFPLAALLALATAACIEVMTDLLPAGLLPQMSGSLRVAPERIGVLVTAFALASSVTAIPVTRWLRRLPRRPVLIAVLTGFALFNAVTAVSASYPPIFAARLLAGVMGGTLWSLLAGYAARMVPAERRGRATAIVLVGITAAMSAGIPAGAAIATVIGWRPLFALLAAAPLVVAVWVRWKVPPLPGQAAPGRPSVGRVTSRPGIRPVLAVTLLLLTGHQALYTYIALFVGRAGLGGTGLVLFVFGAATAAGLWLAGAHADRHLRSLLLTALTVIASATSALGLTAHSPVALLLAVALWGTAFGAAPALLQTALIDSSGPADADVATSLQTTVYNVGIAAGSLTGGLILANGSAAALPWTTALFTTAALVTVAISRRAAFPATRPGQDHSGIGAASVQTCHAPGP